MNMHLAVKGERLIQEIKTDFTKEFPFLKLEFFRNGLIRLDRYPIEKMISDKKKLKDAWVNKKEEGILEITGNMTVLELENALMDRFGLAAQVFRKSGNIWLETIRTDNWTLSQQNNHGLAISEDVHFRSEKDYDLNRGARD